MIFSCKEAERVDLIQPSMEYFKIRDSKILEIRVDQLLE